MIIPPPADVPPAEKLGTVHFVGIGGAGLSGIARIMLARGIPVTGSDARESPTLDGLRDLGAEVWAGHDGGHLEGVDTVVVSTAVKETNPEVTEALRRGVRLLPRAAALRSLLSGRRVVAVSGAHGKTTTTSMLAVALRHTGADPSYAIGGVLTATGSNAYDGTGEAFVVEADESDRAFLHYAPSVAVVTNVDPDHLDMYASAEDYHAAFETFVDSIVPGGVLVVCLDDPGARRLARYARSRDVRTRTYGEAVDADIRIVDADVRPLDSEFGLTVDGVPAGSIVVHVAGQHHILNAAAAYAAGVELGAPPDELAAGISSFTGTRRRFEFKGEAAGVRVFDDYAHHPTELATNMRAARSAAGSGRLVVCYRPLRYTRTQVFHREFGEILGQADEVVVADPTGDDPIEGVSGDLIARCVPLPAERVGYEPSWQAVPLRVAARVRRGDLLLTAGAPDVAEIGPAVLGLLDAGGAEG